MFLYLGKNEKHYFVSMKCQINHHFWGCFGNFIVLIFAS